jgi:DNA repair protein RadC
MEAADDALVIDMFDIGRVTLRELVELVAGQRAPPDLDIDALARADPSAIADAWSARDESGGHLKAARALAAAFELGRRADAARRERRPVLACPADVAEWARPRLLHLPHEELWVLAVDGRQHVHAARCVARGGLHGMSVTVSDPIRAALRADARAFVMVHNHPSGDPTPSAEDIRMTENVAIASEHAGVPLLDHVIVARDGHRSVPV